MMNFPGEAGMSSSGSLTGDSPPSRASLPSGDDQHAGVGAQRLAVGAAEHPLDHEAHGAQQRRELGRRVEPSVEDPLLGAAVRRHEAQALAAAAGHGIEEALDEQERAIDLLPVAPGA